MLLILKKNEKKSSLKIFGDLLVIAEGKLNKEKLTPIDQTQFRFALGGGSFSNEKKYGEALILEEKPYVSWFEEGKMSTATQAGFSSPFLMGVEKTQELDALFHYQAEVPISLEAIYEELAKQYPLGFAIVGYAIGAEFQGRYMKKPPIYHENMGQNLSSYLTEPSLETQKPFCFFGVVIPPHTSFPEKQLRKAFYQDPQQPRPSILQSHTHAALLQEMPAIFPKNEIDFFSILKKPSVTSIAHLLTQSLIQEAIFGIYALDKIV